MNRLSSVSKKSGALQCCGRCEGAEFGASGLEFCRRGSRILHEVWVAETAGLGRPDAGFCWGM